MIRPLTLADVPAALGLSDAAGWNQTAADWRRTLQLAPEGCWGWFAPQLAATATAVSYGAELAWIGMVLTDPAHRGRGLATALMQHALDRLHVGCVKLDATPMGQPLYRKLGFVDERPIERWGAAPQVVSHAGAGEPQTDPRRSALFAALSAEGHLEGRPGSKAAYFGPCIRATADAARAQLLGVLARYSGQPVYWDLFPENAGAVELAREFGFAPLRRLMRMSKPGDEQTGDISQVYAIAGFEYG